jgi:hypothetical protein
MNDRRIEKGKGERGQSLVETVIFLPVLVVIFLGMFYMKGLIDTKARAIEAARYVTWENTWIPREGTGQPSEMDVIEDTRPRAQKSDAQLQSELQQVGLGAFLFRVQGTKKKQSLNDYFNEVKVGGAPMTTSIPAIVDQLFGNSAGFSSNTNTNQFSQNPDSAPGSSGGSSSGSGALSGLDLGSGFNDVLSILGGAAFTVYGVMGHQTKWGAESDESVITSQVVYHYQVGGGGTIFPSRYIAEQSRDGGPVDGADAGHIFDLWLFPSGQPTALRAIKCPFTAIASLTNFLQGLNPFSSGVPLRIPNGTLKEYPEMDLPANTGNGGTGNDGGSGLGGGNTQPPHQ